MKTIACNHDTDVSVEEWQGMGQETFSGRTATESKMEGTHER